MPPKLHCIQQSGWNEGSLSRSWKDSTCTLRDLNHKTRFGKGVVSFLNEVDTVKELSSSIVSFFNEVDIRPRTILMTPYFIFSFNEVDTRRGTILTPFVSFFNEVDTRQGTILISCGSFFNDVDLGTILGQLFMDHMSSWLQRGLH